MPTAVLRPPLSGSRNTPTSSPSFATLPRKTVPSVVLPRKKIAIPKEALDAALRNLEPTFPVGPVMTFRRAGTVKPIVPPPRIEGLVGQFVHAGPAPDGTTEAFTETPVPPVPPVAELPEDRVVLDEGWMRMFKPPT